MRQFCAEMNDARSHVEFTGVSGSIFDQFGEYGIERFHGNYLPFLKTIVEH